MRDEDLKDRITEVVPISADLIMEGERVLEEDRELARQLNTLRDRHKIILAERDVLEAKREANTSAFFRELYKTHPHLADVDCAYSQTHKAVVIYKDEPEDPVDALKQLFSMMAAAQAQPPKEGAN